MIITNSKIITWGRPNQILDNHAVRITDGLISKIGEQKEILELFPEDNVLDARSQYLMPGSICAHTHFYGVFSRGMSIEGNPPANFPAILKQLWWPLDSSLDKEDVYYSAMVCLIDAIKHGTTTIFDHHASPNSIDGSLDVIEQALLTSGLRGCVCYEVSDRGGLEKTKAGIEENLRMIEKVRRFSSPRPMITATFGLHASLTLSNDTLQMCREAAPSGTGFHIHVAEGVSDQEDSLQKTGLRVITRLDEFKLTGPDSIFVHGVHLDHNEIDILAKTGTWLTHQPRSNMNNAVGMANVEQILEKGIPVCIGNDGFSFAMWDEWRTTYLSHKLWNKDPRSMSGEKVITMGAYNNSELASRFFNQKIGVIEEGAAADLILVDYQPVTPIYSENLPWHILFGFRDSMVTTTIVNGNLLMKDRKLLQLNEEEVSNRAKDLASNVWKKYRNQFNK